MRRLFAIFAVLGASLLCSGAKASLHDLSHACVDAIALDAAHHSDRPIPEPTHREEGNCLLHAQLHAPADAPRTLTPLDCLGRLVGQLPEVRDSIHSLRIPARLDCRGPPAC